MTLELNYAKMGTWDKAEKDREWYTEYFSDLATIHVHNRDGGDQWAWVVQTQTFYNSNVYYATRDDAYQQALRFLYNILRSVCQRIESKPIFA